MEPMEKWNTRDILRHIRVMGIDGDFLSDLLKNLEDEVAKCEKQIAMLEDAVLIYHVQRAPTRKAWFINVGQCRGDRAKWIVNDFRDEYVKARGDSNEAVRQEDIYLPMYNDGNSSTVENMDTPTTWDGSALLETFYIKRSRLLSLYSRLYEAIETRDTSKIVSLICEVGSIQSWRMR